MFYDIYIERRKCSEWKPNFRVTEVHLCCLSFFVCIKEQLEPLHTVDRKLQEMGTKFYDECLDESIECRK